MGSVERKDKGDGGAQYTAVRRSGISKRVATTLKQSSICFSTIRWNLRLLQHSMNGLDQLLCPVLRSLWTARLVVLELLLGL